MTRFLLASLSLSLALGLVLAAADASAAVPRARIKVHPTRHWHGYGFLPGYRQPPALSDWRAQNEISAYRAQTDWRYYGWNGEPHYGFGHPGYYRGRYNGGSFGPCWTSTPIGMMPTCGQ